MTKHQNGFAHIGLVILFVVVLSVIGAVAWKVAHKDKPASNTTTSTNTQKDNSESDTTQAAATATLHITEWGVTIPLSSADLNAYYKISETVDQSASDPTNLTVYSKETDTLMGPTGKTCQGEYIAYLMRLPSDDPKWQPSQTVDDGNVSPLFTGRIVIGQYRYAIATKKQYAPECFETTTTGGYQADAATAQKFSDVVSAFVSDFTNITSD